jgi:hypothetical protein
MAESAVRKSILTGIPEKKPPLRDTLQEEWYGKEAKLKA